MVVAMAMASSWRGNFGLCSNLKAMEKQAHSRAAPPIMSFPGSDRLHPSSYILSKNSASSSPSSCTSRFVVRASPAVVEVDSEVMCESCSGKGWLLCDFCKGLKTNVKAENSRIYRRCPSCRATGSVLCPKCKVYRCVTFPDQNDGAELMNF